MTSGFETKCSWSKSTIKLLRAHEQQLSQKTKGNTVTTATSIADSLLAQQQHVIRQQQMLRDMLQKQQKQQQAQLQLQMQLKKKEDKSATIMQAVPTSKIPAKPYTKTAPTRYSVRKKLTKNTFDMDLEALARVCIRVANARTDSEMRQALEKMISWLHRCTELPLLQIAQRDYRDSIAHRRPMLIQQGRWPLDLQVKSEHVTQKIAQMLGAKCAVATALSSSNANSTVSFSSTTAATAATSTTPVATLAITTTSAGCLATVGNSTSSSSTTAVTSIAATATSTIVPKQPAAVALHNATPAATNSSPSTTTTLAGPVKIPAKRDMPAIEREYAGLKVQLQAKQVEINQKAKAKRDAAKLEAAKAMGVISNHKATAAMLPVTHKRPLQVDVPAFAKKQQRTDGYVLPSSSSTAGCRPSTPSVASISPQVAQQFFDLDWTTRTSSESEDKMYLPLKVVSNIMSKVLPGAREEEAAAGGVSTKREEQGKSRTLSLAISPSHSLQKQEFSSQDTISISDEAVTFMQECLTEFLLYITSEARDLSVMQNRRTKKGVGLSISGTDVVKSMENLGFTPYAQVLAGYNEKVKASQDAAARKKMERKKLIQQQTMQKAAAATATTATSAANAAKAAFAAGKSPGLPQAYAQAKTKPTSLPLANTLTMSRPSSSMPARLGITQGIPARTGIATAKPAAAVTTTTAPAMKTIPAAPTTHAGLTTMLHQQVFEL
ncbi:unnamed protein product [Peronospora destructor]|uniref:Transcription factor CBF/NF-Y/archaeal histone domain-containing protein n=1 Tax=Peronospora destructor TaxID=86335 RepID=A0AAV0V4N2_9STRA|nr:unnamed protein product [Peronospora destructor]